MGSRDRDLPARELSFLREDRQTERQTGAPVVPIFARRTGVTGHTIMIRPALPPPAANDSEAAVVELTARCTAEIEEAIREAPEQWLWSHDRWRTRPPADAP